MKKVKSLCILLVLLLIIPSLSSCGNDDEDGMNVGGINLVGTWALIHENGNKTNSYVQYHVKANGIVSASTVCGDGWEMPSAVNHLN